MPTYEYRCKACSHELEVVQAFTDDALTTCEECGGALRKVFGNVGIAFKGTGFYKNDSRGKKTTTSTSADTSGGDKSGGDKSSTSSSDNGSSSTTKKDTAASSSSTGKGDAAKTSSPST